MSKLDRRLESLAAQMPPKPEYKEPIQAAPVRVGGKSAPNIDFSKYNQILPENWEKLAPRDYIRYIKKNKPDEPKGGTIRSINVSDNGKSFVLSSYNRSWSVPFNEITTVYRLNKAKQNPVVDVAATPQPKPETSVLDNFREVSREVTTAKYDQLAADIMGIKRDIVNIKDTLSKLTDWVNRQIEISNQTNK